MPNAARNNGNSLKLFLQRSLRYFDLEFNVAEYSFERRSFGANGMDRRNGRLDELALMHVHEHGRIRPMRYVPLDVANNRVRVDALELNFLNLNYCAIGLASRLAVF